MRRRLTGLAARFSIAIIVLLVVAELALRTMGFGNPVRYARDAACGFLPAPNQHSRRFFAENDINEYGMRSAPIAPHKTPDTFRVMFLGDSVTYGTTHVDQNRIFTSILQRDLPAKMGKKVEVMNVSCGAWGVGNELGYLKSRGTFDADLVVLVLNTSDPLQMPSELQTGDVNYPTNCPMFAVGEVLQRYLLPRISPRFIAHVDAGSTISAADSLGNAPAVLKDLAEAKALANAREAGFAVMYVPFRQDGFNTPMYRAGVAGMMAWCRETHTPLVDMTEEMANYPATLTHLDGAHLRPEGHAIVAARLEREWIPLLAAAASDAGKSDEDRLVMAHGLWGE
jgi:hypothetical protein